MAAVITYIARAVRWERGWELHVDGVGVTQVRTLAHAKQQVRDLIETMTDRDVSGDTVEIRPDLGGLEDDAAAAREHTRRAADAQRTAAAEARHVARELRKHGLSNADTAEVLGISRGRVSQLIG